MKNVIQVDNSLEYYTLTLQPGAEVKITSYTFFSVLLQQLLFGTRCNNYFKTVITVLIYLANLT